MRTGSVWTVELLATNQVITSVNEQMFSFKCYFGVSICISIMLMMDFKSAAEFRKAKKHSLLDSNNVSVTGCLLEESSPKIPTQSPGSQPKDRRCVIGGKYKKYFL